MPTVAALGFRRSACSPLAVVASELTLGAMAYGGRGRGGRSFSRPRGGFAARWPSSKQSRSKAETRKYIRYTTGTQESLHGGGGSANGAGPSPFSGSERPKPGPMLAGGVADTAGARPFER